GGEVDDTVAQEEVFGPVLSVLCVDGDDEAVAVANGTRYRLAAGVWSRDPVRARSVAARIRAEQVWINEYRMIEIADPEHRPAADSRDLLWIDCPARSTSTDRVDGSGQRPADRFRPMTFC